MALKRNAVAAAAGEDPPLVSASAAKPGAIACVGVGMTLGSHISAQARRYIERSDVVFVAVSDSLVEDWVMSMNPDVRSLQVHYSEGKSRLQTYREMVEVMMAEVRAGKNVCGAFYGHPGVFAKAPHDVIAQARAEGHFAVMVPGVSAEDCLVADLGMDPGKTGCISMEASQLLLFKRVLDPSALLILWQVGIVGDASFSRFETGTEQRRLLLKRLLEDYPPEHHATLYEAATLPAMPFRAERITLAQLPDAETKLQTTLVIPPLHKPVANPQSDGLLDA